MNEVWLVILPLIAGYLLDLAFGDPRQSRILSWGLEI